VVGGGPPCGMSISVPCIPPLKNISLCAAAGEANVTVKNIAASDRMILVFIGYLLLTFELISSVPVGMGWS
jgi:hypothetical protein